MSNECALLRESTIDFLSCLVLADLLFLLRRCQIDGIDRDKQRRATLIREKPSSFPSAHIEFELFPADHRSDHRLVLFSSRLKDRTSMELQTRLSVQEALRRPSSSTECLELLRSFLLFVFGAFPWLVSRSSI
jgi:hypothetical protein